MDNLNFILFISFGLVAEFSGKGVCICISYCSWCLQTFKVCSEINISPLGFQLFLKSIRIFTLARRQLIYVRKHLQRCYKTDLNLMSGRHAVVPAPPLLSVPPALGLKHSTLELLWKILVSVIDWGRLAQPKRWNSSKWVQIPPSWLKWSDPKYWTDFNFCFCFFDPGLRVTEEEED